MTQAPTGTRRAAVKPRVDREQVWRETANAAAAFRDKFGRWPSRVTENPREKQLGAWLSKQRSDAKRNESRFTPERGAYLDRVAPGWEGSHDARAY